MEKVEGNHSFLAGTPLHIMLSLSLIRQLNLENSAKLKIIDYFSGAKDVFHRISDLMWDYSNVEVSFYSSHRSAYIDCIKDRTDYFYVDSDASFQRYLDLIFMKALRRDLKVCVFEDGVGSYRTDLYQGLKKRIFDAIGVGTYLGGSPFTDTVFVFEKERYENIFPHSNANIIRIEEPISGTVSRLRDNLHEVFGYKPYKAISHKRCFIYLSSWTVDTAFVKILSDLEGDIFIKLHPHIKGLNIDLDVEKLDNKVPAEIILPDLLEEYEEVIVYHHGTSVEQYVRSDRLTFIRL